MDKFKKIEQLKVLIAEIERELISENGEEGFASYIRSYTPLKLNLGSVFKIPTGDRISHEDTQKGVYNALKDLGWKVSAFSNVDKTALIVTILDYYHPELK